MGRFMQYQTAQAIPEMAAGGGGGGGSTAGDAMGLGAGVVMGQVLAQNLQQGLQGATATTGARGAAEPAPVTVRPEDVIGTLEKLAGLKERGIVTPEEFEAKKAELLRKLA
jgi:membrane protease subunit (stomatin/prohibitin family)